MTDKEKILAKVEFWLNETNYEPFTDEVFGKIQSLKELKSYIDSLQEEPISQDLGEYINELSKQFPDVSFAKLSRIAVRVANWQKEQFEKERFKHCDALTKEQAQIESDFVVDHIKKHNRTPTFIDAIEYGMRLKEQQFEKDYTNLCNGIATAKGLAVAMAYDKGMADAREQMMSKAIVREVKVDAGGYPYIDATELYDYDKDMPLAKEGDKVKILVIKED